MVILGRSCGNPHKHWRIAPLDRRGLGRGGAGHAGAELPLKAFFPAIDGKAATNETEEEFRWQQD
jgi:hypothetical protein